MDYKRTSDAIIVTLEEGEVLNGGTIADLQWEASKYGIRCIINGQDNTYHRKKSFAECDREWMESHSVMGEIPMQYQYNAIDRYFDERAI